MLGVKSEKIDHKNCTPREPNGQNELSSVREGEESRSLSWRNLFLLVTNALFKDFFFLFQTSITPIHTDCNCSDWKGGIGSLVWSRGQASILRAHCWFFPMDPKGTFFLFCINILLWLKLILKVISLMNVVKSSRPLFSKLTSLENGHESPGLAPWICITCRAILGKSLVNFASLVVRQGTGLDDF